MGAGEWWRHPVAILLLWYTPSLLICVSVGLVATMVIQMSPEQFLFYALPTDYQTVPVFIAAVGAELLIFIGNYIFIVMIACLCLALLCSQSAWLKRLE